VIIWQKSAIENRDAQLDYIALDNPKAAIQQGDKIAKNIIKLIDFPKLGRAGRVKSTRELVISGTPFIAIYKISVGHRPRFETSRLDEKQVVPHFISDHPVWQSSLIS
jgi:toxin ParE1/3/4